MYVWMYVCVYVCVCAWHLARQAAYTLKPPNKKKLRGRGPARKFQAGVKDAAEPSSACIAAARNARRRRRFLCFKATATPETLSNPRRPPHSRAAN